MNYRLIVVLTNVATYSDGHKTMIHIFNYDRFQWMKEQSFDNYVGFENLHLLQINGKMHILSLKKTQLFWTMSSNYTFIKEMSWIGKDILKKSEELLIISLDKTLVRQHLND